MTKPDPILEQFLRGKDGKKISEVHVYGSVQQIEEDVHNPAFAGTKIVPRHPLDEGGKIRTQIPRRQ